ncbi:Gibberellin 3-beta-dioxygenase 1 [Heracleum sosnowskyi]|uniref:gibberellin 3beta-dioxygenase n=1 Tax=Heracleum sosnowskyi TaxID=360622 RepID=A0AAD8IJR3_9APIA|nr:Gibberellin 3-beta-dioxygenase 1 [Heracleum sosnowskyi]
MSDLSEAYRDYPVHLQHIIPLDFHTVDSVPESHEWPHSDCLKAVIDEISIPVIDLMDPSAEKLVGHASENWGIFQVTNHGVPLSMLMDVECEARRLFLLPIEEKLKVLRSPEGATGYGAARISPFFSKFMWHEGFTIIGSSSLDHAKELWPHEHKRFCDVIDEYQKKMKELAHKLLLLILKSLEISEEDITSCAASACESNGAGALQFNSYPCCPNPSRAIGLAPHTDSLLLTILNQTQDSSALQIFRDGVGWIPVDPVRDALVVNVGDLLHILSNGKFPSVYHRVIVSEKHRISVAYFYGPRTDSQVAPLSRIEVPIYRSLSVKEFISIKAKHLEKALSFIRI